MTYHGYTRPPIPLRIKLPLAFVFCGPLALALPVGYTLLYAVGGMAWLYYVVKTEV